MTTTTASLTLEEYPAYDDGTENRYELVDGKLTIMPQPRKSFLSSPEPLPIF